MKYKELVVCACQDVPTRELRQFDLSCIRMNPMLPSISNHLDGTVALQCSDAESKWSPHPRRFVATPAQFDRLRVVLVSPRNPLNIGAAARAMSNFGFHHLRVVNPFEAAFREARSAVGAAAVLTAVEEYKTVAEAVADFSLVVGTTAVGPRDLHHSLKRLEAGAPVIRRHFAS